MTEFAAAAAADAESVPVACGLGDFRGLAPLALLVAVGDFAGVLVALAEPLATPDFVASGEDVVARAEPVGAVVRFALPLVLGTALTLRVLPPAPADADVVAFAGVVAFVGVADADAVGVVVGVGVLPADGVGTFGKVLGVGGVGGFVCDFVGVGDSDGLGLLDLGVGDWLGWDDFKSSHCWFVPVTADVMRADTAAEALDVPSWSAEATKE